MCAVDFMFENFCFSFGPYDQLSRSTPNFTSDLDIHRFIDDISMND
jgi:hypothetical protein